MITKLKSGLDMEYLEDKRILRITIWQKQIPPIDPHFPDMMPETIDIKYKQIRSLGCMCNRVAWHKERKHK